MDITITAIDVKDIRFPTSLSLDGSDAMNPDPDYSAAYVILKTDTDFEGHGLTFTIGRGNEICTQAIQSMAYLVVGKKLSEFTSDMGAFWKMIRRQPVTMARSRKRCDPSCDSCHSQRRLGSVRKDRGQTALETDCRYVSRRAR